MIEWFPIIQDIYMAHMPYLAFMAYLAYVPYGQNAMTMSIKGVYQKHSEKLAHLSKLELI